MLTRIAQKLPLTRIFNLTILYNRSIISFVCEFGFIYFCLMHLFSSDPNSHQMSSRDLLLSGKRNIFMALEALFRNPSMALNASSSFVS